MITMTCLIRWMPLEALAVELAVRVGPAEDVPATRRPSEVHAAATSRTAAAQAALRPEPRLTGGSGGVSAPRADRIRPRLARPSRGGIVPAVDAGRFAR